MATVIWQGGAPAVAQVDTVTVGGTIEASDVFNLTIGDKTLAVVAGSTVAGTVATTIAAAWNALSATSWPEFAEVTAAATTGGALTLTADTAGKPFVCTVATTETGGGAADDQTIGTAATVANAGPNCWDSTANWDTGVVPVATNDVMFENSSVSCLYGFPALSSVTLASLTIKQSYTGYLGLPRHTGLYPEYRSQYATISATTLNIGQGEGNGSGRIKVNVGTIQTTANVYGSATAAETYIPAVLLLGTHAANVVNVVDGDVGVAFFGGEVSTVATVKQGGGRVRCGLGLTHTTYTQYGGESEVRANCATVGISGGTMTFAGTATTTAMTISRGATVYYESNGTATAINVDEDSRLDFSRDARARTVSTLHFHRGADIRDPGSTLTATATTPDFST